MKTRSALIVSIAGILMASVAFADATLTTIYPQRSLTLGGRRPDSDNTVEVADGSINVAGTDSSVSPAGPASYKVEDQRVLSARPDGNYFIGGSGNTTGGGQQNICLGDDAGINMTDANYNIFLGTSAGQYNTAGWFNVYVGASAGKGSSGAYIAGRENTFVGYNAGNKVTGGTYTPGGYNTCLGSQSGNSITSGNYNVFLGYGAGFVETGSSKLYIESAVMPSNTALIYGDFSTTSATPRSVGINTTSLRPGYKLTVDGSVYVNGAVYATNGCSSDMRWKSNVETLNNPIDKISRLRGVTFDWKREEFKDRNLPAGRQIGVIAQEIEKEYPELVMTDNEGYKSVAYEKLTAVLLEAVKAQQQEIRALQAEVAALKKPGK